jgi:dTDP-4-amino-4,6-dideoxygalactose transaminase
VSAIGPREIAAAVRVLSSGRLGRYGGDRPSVTGRFETELAQLTGARHALAVNSGTSALMAALAGAGVGPGDEVLIPAYTWVSTAAAPLALGAVPVLVEVDASLTMDPVDLKTKITPATKAVVPVHMLNLVCDMDAIMRIADEHGLLVVEDACQALGVTYKGRRAGTIGHAGAFSFSQTKSITSGEGGAVVTDDDRIAVRATMFHDVGSYTRADWEPTDEPVFVGLNLKMSDLSASVLLPQLRRLDAQMARRAARRRAAVEELSVEDSIHIGPHHDPENAVGLTVVFDDPEDARRFAAGQRGAHRLMDTSRHVYTNWQSILGGRTFDPRFDPYGQSGPSVRGDSAPRTLEILERAVAITLRADLPVAVTRVAARRMARYRSAG